MKRFSILLLSFVILFINHAIAVTPVIGDVAPEFDEGRWIKNKPQKSTLVDLLGEVILIEIWGVRCVICAATMPEVQKLHDEYKNKGLHIFTFEGQSHESENVLMFAEIYGSKTLPIAGELPTQYNSAKSAGEVGEIPYAWLIGIDGRIIWQGIASYSNYKNILEAELAKIPYPGLWKNEFTRKNQKGANYFVDEKYCKAWNASEDIINNGESNEGDVNDAIHIQGKVHDKLTFIKSQAEELESTRDYNRAFDLYKYIAKTFQKCDSGKEAKEKVKELSKDKEIWTEIVASSELETLLEKIKAKAGSSFKADLLKFSRKYKSTKAALRAEILADYKK